MISRGARDTEVLFPFIHETTSYSRGFVGSDFNDNESWYQRGNPRDPGLADDISWGSQWLREHSL